MLAIKDRIYLCLAQNQVLHLSGSKLQLLGGVRIILTQASLPGSGLPMPTPGREAKSLKNGIPTLLHMKASTKTNKWQDY